MIRGLDISSVQGDVDFRWLVQHGFQFVIVKCYTGNDGKDSHYDRNVAGARAVGLKVAAYQFVYPLPTDAAHPTRDPKVQAKMHYEAAGDVPVHCCDLEWPEPKDWAKWGCTAPQIKQWALDYIAEYERLSGKRMVLYTYPSFANVFQLSSEFAKYPLWIASYLPSPTIPHPWTSWALWQDGGGNTGDKLVLPNGIPVDSDMAKDLSLWDESVPEPTPIPTPPQPEPPPPMENPLPPTPPPVVSPPQSTNFLTVLLQALQSLLNNLFKK